MIDNITEIQTPWQTIQKESPSERRQQRSRSTYDPASAHRPKEESDQSDREDSSPSSNLDLTI